MPAVSVVMCVFNAEAFLHEAMGSIFAQTFRDFELIVVDDASTDRTPEILAGYTDPRIRVIRNSSNLGVGRARNRGLRLARGKYIAMHDADDASVPDRLAQEVAYLESHPEVGLVGSAAFWVTTSQTLSQTFPDIRDFRFPDSALNLETAGRLEFDTNWFALPSNGQTRALFVSPLSDLAIAWTLLRHSAFCNPTVMFRRTVYEQVGGFSEKQEHRYCEDYAMFSKFARQTRLANLESPLITYHYHSDSTSAKHAAEQAAQQEGVQQENLCWIMGCESVAPETWLAWRKFVFPTIPASPLTFEEVKELRALLPIIASNFYAAYDLGNGAEVKRHHRQTLFAWARHAIGLSYKPRKTVGFISRLLLALLGIRLLANILYPKKATRSCGRNSTNSNTSSH
jgi:glycosyltransferase involved in cell wall biosynthesis